MDYLTSDERREVRQLRRKIQHRRQLIADIEVSLSPLVERLGVLERAQAPVQPEQGVADAAQEPS